MISGKEKSFAGGTSSRHANSTDAPKETALPFTSNSKCIRIRREDESQHMMANGDTGTGKTTLLRQLLHYVRTAAIVRSFSIRSCHASGSSSTSLRP